MFYRVVLTTACVLVTVGCEQAATSDSPIGVTAPSALSVKAVEVPFSGAVTGGLRALVNPQNCPSGRTSVNDATGTALHIGRITYHTEQCVDQSVLPWGVDGRVLILTAANGDKLHGTFTGQSTVPGGVGTEVHVSGTFVFRGGTGRFEDATGTAEMTGVITQAATFPWPGRWEWKGTIRY